MITWWGLRPTVIAYVMSIRAANETAMPLTGRSRSRKAPPTMAVMPITTAIAPRTCCLEVGFNRP